MKKVWALLAGAAAFAGAAWYLNKKKKDATKLVYSEEFDETSEPAQAPEEGEDGLVVELDVEKEDA